jgi:predicted RNase H-like HicB family nuclease
MKKFKISMYKSEKWYVVECIELPGCVSQGKTKTEALKNIKEAIELYLESVEAHKERLPRVKFSEIAVSA